MSTGITILNANYGNANGTVDVTKTVVSMVKNGILSIPPVSATSLNVTDPAPGQPKKLTFSYSINGGSTISETVNDNEPFVLDAPPARDANGIRITKAMYGYDGNMTDVTDAVQNQLKSDGSIKLKVGFAQVGLPDPNPNKQKKLSVEYTINGASNKKDIKDGDTFSESAPSVTSPSNTTLSQDTGNFMSALIAAVFKAIGYMLFFASIFICVRVAEPIFGSQWGGIVGLVPGAAFWLLPLILMTKRMFYDGDTITDSIPQLEVSSVPVLGSILGYMGAK